MKKIILLIFLLFVCMNLYAKDSENIYTGLIINCLDFDLERAICPRILLPNREVFWCGENANFSLIEEKGIVAYSRSIEEAKKSKRVGSNPLIINAIGTAVDKNFIKDIIISQKDAEIITKENKKSKFLAKFNVIILMDKSNDKRNQIIDVNKLLNNVENNNYINKNLNNTKNNVDFEENITKTEYISYDRLLLDLKDNIKSIDKEKLKKYCDNITNSFGKIDTYFNGYLLGNTEIDIREFPPDYDLENIRRDIINFRNLFNDNIENINLLLKDVKYEIIISEESNFLKYNAILSKDFIINNYSYQTVILDKNDSIELKKKMYEALDDRKLSDKNISKIYAQIDKIISRKQDANREYENIDKIKNPYLKKICKNELTFYRDEKANVDKAFKIVDDYYDEVLSNLDDYINGINVIIDKVNLSCELSDNLKMIKNLELILLKKEKIKYKDRDRIVLDLSSESYPSNIGVIVKEKCEKYRSKLKDLNNVFTFTEEADNKLAKTIIDGIDLSKINIEDVINLKIKAKDIKKDTLNQIDHVLQTANNELEEYNVSVIYTANTNYIDKIIKINVGNIPIKVEVLVTGFGKTMEEALLDAKRRAILKTKGCFIDGYTESKDFGNIIDENIKISYEGAVLEGDGEEIFEKGKCIFKGKFIVTINDVLDENQRINLYKKAGEPKFLVVEPSETNISEVLLSLFIDKLNKDKLNVYSKHINLSNEEMKKENIGIKIQLKYNENRKILSIVYDDINNNCIGSTTISNFYNNEKAIELSLNQYFDNEEIDDLTGATFYEIKDKIIKNWIDETTFFNYKITFTNWKDYEKHLEKLFDKDNRIISYSFERQDNIAECELSTIYPPKELRKWFENRNLMGRKFKIINQFDKEWEIKIGK